MKYFCLLCAPFISFITGQVTLTSPGGICLGQTAVYHCISTEGFLVWRYNNIQIASSAQSPVTTNMILIDTIQQINFTVTYFIGTTQLVSTLNFLASSSADGSSVQCSGIIDEKANVVAIVVDDEMPTFSEFLLNDVRNDTISTTVELKINVYDGRKVALIDVGSAKAISSQVFMATLFSANISFFFNTLLNITIASSNCFGSSTTSLTIFRGKCALPHSANGAVILPFTDQLEGSIIMYTCETGYSPKNIMKSTCSRIGFDVQWLPDPNLHTCNVVTCGSPPAPNNGLIDSNSNIYREGDEVSTSCKPNFFPKTPRKIVCTVAQSWYPNPNELECRKNMETIITALGSTTGVTTVLLIAGAAGVSGYAIYKYRKTKKKIRERAENPE